MKEEFENIYRKNYQKLYTLAFRMTGTKEDAEDVLQIAFLNAYKGFENFRGDSAAYTWLYRIVINAANRFHRKNYKLPVDKYADENNISIKDVYNYINRFGTVEDKAIANQTKESCLQMFINCMPSKYRSVYTVREILSFSVKDSAKILDISEASVKTNLHRAKKILKSHFHGRCSLIDNNGVCDCRSFARFLKENNKTMDMMEIDVIREKERESKEEFENQLSKIFMIDDLYHTNIKPMEYSKFLNHVKELVEKDSIEILNY